MIHETCDGECAAGCSHSALTHALPLVRDLLLPAARDDGLVVALADRYGRLRYVEGGGRARRRADDIGFAVGADWSELEAGTNAPGRAVASGAAVSVRREEHTRPEVHPFSCSAAPLTDPATGEVVGAIDVTGGDAAAARPAVALLRATAAAVQRELRLVARDKAENHALQHMDGEPPVRLRLVRGGRPRLDIHGVSHPLTDRHAELLVLLALEPDGVSADELGAMLYPERAPSGTVRVELLRLRRWLAHLPGAPALQSRPYRLSAPISVDALEVAAHLNRGEHEQALELYRGMALHRTESGRVLTLLTETSTALRDAMLGDATPQVLLRYLELPEVRDDAEPWQVALKVLPPRAPQRAGIVAHLETMNRR